MLHDISPGSHHIALEIGGYHAVIPDKGEGLNHYLPPIAGVGYGLKIPAHAGGKNHLRRQLSRGPEPAPLKNAAVFQHQIRFFAYTLHAQHVPFLVNYP